MKEKKKNPVCENCSLTKNFCKTCKIHVCDNQKDISIRNSIEATLDYLRDEFCVAFTDDAKVN